MKELYLFGDSIFKGITYSDVKKRYRVCGKRDFEKLAEQGIDVKNFSKLGATVEHGYAILKSKLAGNAEGTTIVLEYGGNDCDFDWEDVSDHPEGKHAPKLGMEKFLETYRKCIQYAREHGARVVLANLVPLDAEKYMDWIARGREYNNILGWLGDQSMLYRWHEYYNRAVEDLAREMKCGLLDLRSMFLLSHDYKSLMCEDGIHPTEEGHRAIEDFIMDYAMANA